MKKWIALLLALLLCLGCAACGTDATQDTTVPETTASTEEKEPFDWGQAMGSSGGGCAMPNEGGGGE